MMDNKPTPEATKRFFDRVHFELVVSRDASTAEFLYSAVPELNVESGIDLAFFIHDAIRVPKLSSDFGKYIAYVFDQTAEPRISDASFPDSLAVEIGDNILHLGNREFNAEPKVKNFLRRILESTANSIDQVGEFRIVRSDHRFNPFLQRKIYSKASTFSLDTPEGYLTLYANSEIVISNRVHACVAALSYGRPCVLFSKSRRNGLFEAVAPGCSDHYPIRIDPVEIGLNDTKALYTENVGQKLKKLL